jgi:Coenzyme PQQ synthesis protein D (PqqD)
VKWRVNPQVVSRQLGTSVVLVNLESNAIHELNATGGRVLELLSIGVDDGELEQLLALEFEAAPDVLREDVQRLMSELRAAGVIVPVNA